MGGRGHLRKKMAIEKQIEIEFSYLKTWFLTIALEIFTKVNKT
jgi:hypothetical protein